MKQPFEQISEAELREFTLDGDYPYRNRLFFIQHLLPYIFLKDSCKDKKVLEIGIGDGFGSYYLSKGAATVFSLDLDPETWPNLRKYITRYRVKNIRFTRANACMMPYKEKTFDRIITGQVIEHIPEHLLLQFVRELRRVLKDDGQLLISTLNVEHNIKNPQRYEKFAPHHKEFTAAELEALLRKVFPDVRLFGVNRSSKHLFFQRLKKWGLLKYPHRFNPVKKFYARISSRHYFLTPRITKKSLDLYAFCTKKVLPRK